MLEYEVVPEICLRNKFIEYIIGMNICQAISALQRLSRIIKGVELLYNNEAPTQNEIVINSTQEGIKLYFDPVSQLLRVIEIYDLNKIALRYCTNVFSIPDEKTTVEQVEQAFGATHPGTYDSSLQVYILSWRGISFSFPTDSNVQPLGAGLGSLNFPPGTIPVVSKICIFSGNCVNESKPEMPLSCYNGNCYLNSLEILRKNNKTLGIKVFVCCEDIGSQRFSEIKKQHIMRNILFGDDTQDVLSAVGSPSKVFYKSEDKMKIHLPSNQRLKIGAGERADYFFNYFTLGLDVLFDGMTQKVKKFIVHTNYPGHYDFGIYFRCPFVLDINFDTAVFDAESAESDANKKAEKCMKVDAFTKWNDIQDVICDPFDLFTVPPSSDGGGSGDAGGGANQPSGSAPSPSKQSPVVLNRTGANAASNPFGSTFCYAFHDIIFEVMPNNYVASLTLFDDSMRCDDNVKMD